MPIWFDVEDLFVHAAGGRRRVSGIQRFVIELLRALRQEAAASGAAPPRLLRQATFQPGYYEVEWETLAALFAPPAPVPGDSPTESAPAASPEPYGGAPPPPGPGLQAAGDISALHRLVRRIPPRVRIPLARRVYSARDSARDGARLTARSVRRRRDAVRDRVSSSLRALQTRREAFGERARSAVRRLRAIIPTPKEAPSELPSRLLASVHPPARLGPGDTLIVAGAGWMFADHARRIGAERARGARVALLVHDIIPVRRPEFTGRHAHEAFIAWFSTVMPLADRVLTVSRWSAQDIARWTSARGLPTVRPVVIPMGTEAPKIPQTAALLPFAPKPSGYALSVSTLEPRKNQAFLVRVWRALTEQLPAERIPTLLLAGHVGGNVRDMLAELAGSDDLDGLVRIVADPHDDLLAELYRGCRFTIFPSLYEGWGLPVSESLAFGKPCLASSATSIPEAGGSLARYFDPECVADAVRAIRSVVDDPAELGAWTKEVERDYRPTPWQDTANALLKALDAPPVTAASLAAVLP